MTERVFTENEYCSDEELDEAKEKFPKKDRIHALIHRLECAEEFIKQHRCSDPECEDTQAWRKSAGRE